MRLSSVTVRMVVCRCRGRRGFKQDAQGGCRSKGNIGFDRDGQGQFDLGRCGCSCTHGAFRGRHGGGLFGGQEGNAVQGQHVTGGRGHHGHGQVGDRFDGHSEPKQVGMIGLKKEGHASRLSGGCRRRTCRGRGCVFLFDTHF